MEDVFFHFSAICPHYILYCSAICAAINENIGLDIDVRQVLPLYGPVANGNSAKPISTYYINITTLLYDTVSSCHFSDC